MRCEERHQQGTCSGGLLRLCSGGEGTWWGMRPVFQRCWAAVSNTHPKPTPAFENHASQGMVVRSPAPRQGKVQCCHRRQPQRQPTGCRLRPCRRSSGLPAILEVGGPLGVAAAGRGPGNSPPNSLGQPAPVAWCRLQGCIYNLLNAIIYVCKLEHAEEPQGAGNSPTTATIIAGRSSRLSS